VIWSTGESSTPAGGVTAPLRAGRRPDLRSATRELVVIEDDTDTREALERLFVARDYRVRSYADGRAALDGLRAGPTPSLIVLDLMLPELDGWELRVALKDDPRLAPVPVVVISADITAKAAAVDSDAYLPKPFEFDHLLDVIQRLLDADSAERSRQRQARQAQLERLASLGMLAAGVAHELNNPLAYVMLNLGFLDEELKKLQPTPEPDLLQALAEALEGAERIRRIVADLKLLSHPGLDEEDDVDVNELIESALGVTGNRITACANLIRDLDEVPPVRVSPPRLAQVFINLLVNAAQAIDPGEPAKNAVTIRTRRIDDHVVISITDTGCGIPARDQWRIFDPFYTTKQRGEGTGLGLAMCLGIVTGYGGRITVDSEPGAGTTFSVLLPAAGPTPS
jgi:signal transduction histidine kinase